jgi:Tfp pilus assembly protein PilV
MFRCLRNRRGISLTEALIACFLITIGVLALITVQPSGWRLSRTSDLLGRAAGILQAELEANEILIMNGNNTVTNTPVTKPVNGSGKVAPDRGDVTYTVQTTRTNLGGSWRVTVRVTWPTNPTGITESLIVLPQAYFAQ